ncbi:MAG: transposase [Methanothrix sp.]|nr:transposase [Methanothrix sp.]
METKEIVAIEVTDERVSEGNKFNSLVNQAEENLPDQKIEKALGDGAFYRRDVFDQLQEKQIQPVINTRSNANAKARG